MQPVAETPGERAEKIIEEVKGVTAQYGVSGNDMIFLQTIRHCRILSEKQAKWLADIESRVWPDTDDDTMYDSLGDQDE